MSTIDRKRDIRILKRIIQRLIKKDISKPRNYMDFWILSSIVSNLNILEQTKQEREIK